jgi:tRNA1(Val) A37 N6-methylase TrmN6
MINEFHALWMKMNDVHKRFSFMNDDVTMMLETMNYHMDYFIMNQIT